MKTPNLLLGLLSLATLTSCAPVIEAGQSAVQCEEPTKVVKRTVPSTTFSNKVIFSPPSDAGWTDPRVLYARVTELESGALLATWENYSPEPPLVYFPIYQSLDGGLNWAEISQVIDEVNNWGLRYQPFLYQLPQAIGDFPAGTVILAGNSIPTDLSLTKIDVYVSTDNGFTWKFVSSVAEGGEAQPINGLTPIWEPFLMVYQDELVLYYSDQRDSKYGQKLVHQTTSDLLQWSDPVDDVADSRYAGRPGMPVISLLPNGQYFLSFELCGTDGCRVHYRMSENPLEFNNAADYSLTSDKGTRPSGSPYNVWTSQGGDNGTIILSASSTSNIFINKNLGASDSWVELSSPQPRAYTRALHIYRDDPNLLGLIGGGYLPPSSVNYVSNSVMDLAAAGV